MDDIGQHFSAHQMMVEFTQRMEYFESELQKNLNQAPNISSLSVEFSSFKAFTLCALRTLQDQITMNARSIDHLEMRGRRKILLIHGVPEDQKENTSLVVARTVASKLKMPQFTSADISRCHRMGRSTSNKPRPILFKMHDVAVRDNVWFAKTNLKNSGITISEFLTKSRHEVFMAARQRFGISKCWTQAGNVVVVSSDGSRQRVNWMGDLDKIVGPSQLEPAAIAAASPELPATSSKLQAVVKEAAVPKARRAAASKK